MEERSSTSLLSFVASLMAAASPSDLARRYIDGIRTFVPAAAAGVYIFDPRDRRVEHSATCGVSDYFLTRYEDVGRKVDPLLSHVLAQRAPADSRALMDPQRWRDSPVYTEVFHLHALTRVVEVPILLDGEIAGTLNLGSKRGCDAITPEHVALASAMGRLLGAALHGLRQRELVARDRDAALAALDLCGQPVAVTDLKTGSRRVNAALRDLERRAAISADSSWIDELMALGEAVDHGTLATATVSARDGHPTTLRMYSVSAGRDNSLVVSVVTESREVDEPRPISVRLTPRELEIAELVAQGLRDAEVAERLFISTHTVKHYLKSVYRKIGASSRVQLTRMMLTGGHGISSHASGDDGAIGAAPRRTPNLR